jgi:hypothetical protein
MHYRIWRIIVYWHSNREQIIRDYVCCDNKGHQSINHWKAKLFMLYSLNHVLHRPAKCFLFIVAQMYWGSQHHKHYWLPATGTREGHTLRVKCSCSEEMSTFRPHCPELVILFHLIIKGPGGASLLCAGRGAVRSISQTALMTAFNEYQWHQWENKWSCCSLPIRRLRWKNAIDDCLSGFVHRWAIEQSRKHWAQLFWLAK